MTMKLYHIPGSCSLFPHIVALELGIPVEMVRVFYRSQTTEAGEDYSLVNPMGYVPSLGLDDGMVLRESAVIAEYLADLHPDKDLVPAHGTLERYRLHEWLAFIGTEIHKGFQPLLQQAQAGAYVDVVRPRLFGRFAFVDSHLQTNAFLMGERFSIADAYLYTVTRWGSAAWMGRATDIDLTPLNHLREWFLRVSAMASVQEAVAFAEQR
jgi:glutathione S-transferase